MEQATKYISLKIYISYFHAVPFLLSVTHYPTCTRKTSRARTGLYTPAADAMKGFAEALDSVLATSTPTFR